MSPSCHIRLISLYGLFCPTNGALPEQVALPSAHQKHSTNSLPSVSLSKDDLVNCKSATASLPSALCRTLDKVFALDKEVTLPSVWLRHLTKVTAVSCRWLLTTLCRVLGFAESWDLGKGVFAESRFMPSFQSSAKTLFAECFLLTSVSLDKACFAESR